MQTTVAECPALETLLQHYGWASLNVHLEAEEPEQLPEWQNAEENVCDSFAPQLQSGQSS